MLSRGVQVDYSMVPRTIRVGWTSDTDDATLRCVWITICKIVTGFPHLLENLENIVHIENLEKSWSFAKNNKNHGNIMEFCQSGNVGTLK